MIIEELSTEQEPIVPSLVSFNIYPNTVNGWSEFSGSLRAPNGAIPITPAGIYAAVPNNDSGTAKAVNFNISALFDMGLQLTARASGGAAEIEAKCQLIFIYDEFLVSDLSYSNLYDWIINNTLTNQKCGESSLNYTSPSPYINFGATYGWDNYSNLDENGFSQISTSGVTAVCIYFEMTKATNCSSNFSRRPRLGGSNSVYLF